MQPYDIFLTCAPKDYNKLPFVVDSIRQHMVGYEEVHLVTPGNFVPHLSSLTIPVIWHDETSVLAFDKRKMRHRPGWQYQMYLKLFQQVTKNDWYFTLDCDVLLLQPLPLWCKLQFAAESGKPIYYLGKDQHHEPYFAFQSLMLGLEKVAPFSFIADMNFIHRPIINEMLQRFGHTRRSFVHMAYELTNAHQYLAEPELYGTYVWVYHQDLYHFQKLRVAKGDARLQKEPGTVGYTDNEINEMITRYSTGEYDIVPIHSWWNEGIQNV